MPPKKRNKKKDQSNQQNTSVSQSTCSTVSLSTLSAKIEENKEIFVPSTLPTTSTCSTVPINPRKYSCGIVFQQITNTTPYLRDFFCTRWKEAFGELNSTSIVENIHLFKGLHNAQIETLKSQNIANWDISLLCRVILLLSDGNHFSQSDSKLDNKIKCIKMIREIRNTCCHAAEFQIEEEVYLSFKERIKEIYEELGVTNIISEPELELEGQAEANLLKEQGNMYFQNKEFEMAKEYYSKGLLIQNVNPQVKAELFSKRSEVEFLLQNFHDAKQDARRAQSCVLNWWEAYYREGLVLHELGKFGKAISAFDYAFFLSPNNIDVMQSKEKTVARKEEIEGNYSINPQSVFSVKTRKIIPENAGDSITQGDIYFEKRLYEKALDQFEIALKIAEGNEKEKHIIPIIQKKINSACYEIKKYEWNRSPMPKWEDNNIKKYIESVGLKIPTVNSNGEINLNHSGNEYLMNLGLTTQIIIKGHNLRDSGRTDEAIIEYTKAAEKGSAEGQLNLGLLLQKKRSHVQEGKQWLEKAAAQNHYLFGDFKFKDIPRPTNLGVAHAQNALGVGYRDGLYGPIDYKISFNWFAKSARNGFSIGQHNLAYAYGNGHGVDKDLEKYFYWNKKSAEAGYSWGMFSLGMCYYQGEGTEVNFTLAKKWFEEASKDNCPQALMMLAEFEGDNRKKTSFYTDACESGDPEILFTLAMKYITQDDFQKAIPLLKKAYKARDYRHAPSAFELGLCYYEGKGVETNKFKAFKWFFKSGEAEIPEAQYYVFRLYLLGEGCIRNITLAKQWLGKSAQNGCKEARLIFERMTSSNEELDSMIRSHDNLKSFLYEKGLDINYYTVTTKDIIEKVKANPSKEMGDAANEFFSFQAKLESLSDSSRQISPSNSTPIELCSHFGYEFHSLQMYLDQHPKLSLAANNYLRDLIAVHHGRDASLNFLYEGNVPQAIEYWYNTCLIQDHELILIHFPPPQLLEACSKCENNYKAMFVLANLSMSNTQYAIQLLNKCIILNKKIYQFYSLRACMKMFGKEREVNYHEAIQDFTKALALHPNCAWLHYLRAATYKIKGESKLALADYHFYINNTHELERKIPEAYYSIAFLSMKDRSVNWKKYYRLAEEATSKLPFFHKKEQSTTKQLIDMIIDTKQNMGANFKSIDADSNNSANITKKNENYNDYSVKELISRCQEKKIEYSGCLEKEDLVNLLLTNNAAETEKNVNKKKCSQCGLLLNNVLSCSRCHSSYYCNRDCQRAHWPKHKIFCK